jgi:hemoglobin
MPLASLLLLLAQAAPAEEPVAPYAVSDANAGAHAFAGSGMAAAFHGQAGIARIVDDLVATNQRDPRISDIFKGQDLVRLRRVLKEQFCFLLGAGCAYTGRDMATAHKDMGIQANDMNALVENLQAAMRREGVPFAKANAFLSKLAPMRGHIVTR